ncbi:hypothetical protein ACFVWL_02260 [Microbacterium sp. NPDC058269]|uniref:hypothetical protein n=1 Tax=Microbacterium sp. NPDC058269 TaxID=3346414 RepID=UPI0036DF9976
MRLFRRRPKETNSVSTPIVQAENPTPVRGPAFTGRALALKYPASPDFAASHAEQFVTSMEEFEGIRLDYSRNSLLSVDTLLGSFEEGGSDAVATSVFEAGCYVGEVFVRHHGYAWVDVGDSSDLFDFRMVITGPHGNYANPIGRAFKRVENGPEDSVSAFVTGILATAQGAS